MILGVGAAWADADEITLKVTVQAGAGGTVAVSKFNTSTQDEDFTSGSTEVTIWSSSRCNNAASASLPWSQLSTRTSKTQRNENKVNYAYIAAKANPGYRFIGWADAAGADPRVSPASTAITTKYSTISNYHRDWKFETVTDNGTWNGIVKYAVTNYGLWAEHYDTKALYAYFAKENTITFNPGDGATVTPTSKIVLTGDPFGALPTPTRPGYEFAGWWTEEAGGTQVEPTTIKADNDQTLYAHWTAHTITISFVDNERPQTGEQAATFESISNVTVGGDMPDLPTTDYKKDWYSQVPGDKYFAGWYTRINGGGERIYTGVEDNDHHLTLATPGKKCTFTENTTLYAHYTHVKHVATWDYTYLNFADNNMIWTDINSGDGSTRIKYGKLTFMDANGNAIKSVYFSGNDAVTKESTREISDDITTHITTHGTFHLQVLDGSHAETQNNTVVTGTISGTTADVGTWDVYFKEEDLAKFARYNFEPIATPASQGIVEVKANNWIRTTNLNGHTTLFSFNGAGGTNVADLSWTVTLTDLKVFPDKVIAKPLFWDGSKWAEISQLVKVDGVHCERTDDKSDQTKATYTGKYPVWKYGSTEAYGYALGMVGFEIGGKTIYMNSEHPGQFDTRFNSANSNVEGDVKTSKWPNDNTAFPEIVYTIDASIIPVIRFQAGPEEGAKLAGDTPEIVWVTENIQDFGTKYYATRPGYKFVAWKDTDSETTWGLNDTYLITGAKAKTLNPVWQETTPPVIYADHIDYMETGATIYVSVTDNVGVSAVQYIVSEDEISDEALKESTEWADAKADAAPLYKFDALFTNINNQSYAHVYVKASDAAGNATIKKDEHVKIDGVKPTYDIYPLSNVCNFDVEITAKDNLRIQTVEYVKTISELTEENVASAGWTVVNAFKTSSDTQKEFTVTKLGGSETTRQYLSLRITDEAGNVTLYLNHTTMYYDHQWNEVKSHVVTIKENETYHTYTFYECDHECGHVWVEGYTIDGITFGKPVTEESGKQKYEHQSTLNGTSEEETKKLRTYQEQGLMRTETDKLLEKACSVIVTDSKGNLIAIAKDINGGITEAAKSEGNIIRLEDNVNVGETGVKAFPDAVSLTNPVTIDLNGFGLLVDGNPADGQDGHEESITGNEKVTILLNDGGETEYNNLSKVKTTPIKYHRSFAATTRANKWQALYLPFDAGTVSAPAGETYTFGTAKGVKITSEAATLQIEKSDVNMVHNHCYFVKSSNGEVLINKTTDLYGYTRPEATTVPTLDGGTGTFAIKGSLTNDDNAVSVGATKNDSYWVLTNGGAFNWAKAGTHQRPYHWVIYYTPAAGGEEARPTTLSIVEVEDDPTAIRDITVDEAEQAEAAIYSLSGQRMPAGATLPSGIYVRNGKKIYVK